MPINLNGISTYTPSSGAARDNVATGFQRVSSGQRINSAADDAAGLAIATRFSKEIDGLAVAARNASDGISLVQVADGALKSVTSNIERIRELALRSANATLTDQDRQALSAEANQLQEENQSILEKSSFNGVQLLNGNNEFNFQVGPNAGDQLNVPGNNLADSLASLGLNEIDISTQAGASQALSVLDDASEQINSQRSDFGATANRLEKTIDNLDTTRVNEAEARSRIQDADLAKELTEISAGLIRDQVGIAVQAQANSQRGFVLQLLQPS